MINTWPCFMSAKPQNSWCCFNSANDILQFDSSSNLDLKSRLTYNRPTIGPTLLSETFSEMLTLRVYNGTDISISFSALVSRAMFSSFLAKTRREGDRFSDSPFHSHQTTATIPCKHINDNKFFHKEKQVHFC